MYHHGNTMVIPPIKVPRYLLYLFTVAHGNSFQRNSTNHNISLYRTCISLSRQNQHHDQPGHHGHVHLGREAAPGPQGPHARQVQHVPGGVCAARQEQVGPDHGDGAPRRPARPQLPGGRCHARPFPQEVRVKHAFFRFLKCQIRVLRCSKLQIL